MLYNNIKSRLGSIFDLLKLIFKLDSKTFVVTLFLECASSIFDCIYMFGVWKIIPEIGVFNKEHIDAHIPGSVFSIDSFMSLSSTMLVFAALYVSRLVLSVFIYNPKQKGINELRESIGYRLRRQYFQCVTEASWQKLITYKSSEYMSVLNSDVLKVISAPQPFIGFISLTVITLPFYIYGLYSISPLALIIILFTAALLIPVYRKSRIADEITAERINKTNLRQTQSISEFFYALKLIKVHGVEGNYLDQFSKSLSVLQKEMSKTTAARLRYQTISKIVTLFVTLTILSVSFFYINIEATGVAIIGTILIRFTPLVTVLNSLIHQIDYASVAYSNIIKWENILKSTPIINALGLYDDGFNIKSGIKFSDVIFSYPNSNKSFSIPSLYLPHNTFTAVVGPTGAGKTTFIDLLSGLYVPSSGSISIDDKSLIELCGWRDHIAYVPQENVLFDCSIRDNIAWGCNFAVSDDEILRALEDAAALDFVQTLPMGLDTTISKRDGGIKLSGGERQRIALARAFLRKPLLLILDEATNALDLESQRLIFDSIGKMRGKITLIVITHRIDDIKTCFDGVVHVKSGHISSWNPVVS